MIHQNIGKFPAYLADGFFMEKAIQKKFSNQNSQSFIKNDERERKGSKIPLKINNYGLVEISKENTEKKPEAERKTSVFSSRKTEKNTSRKEEEPLRIEEPKQPEKRASRTEEHLEILRSSEKKLSQKEENSELFKKREEINEKQKSIESMINEQKVEKKITEEKIPSMKIESINKINNENSMEKIDRTPKIKPQHPIKAAANERTPTTKTTQILPPQIEKTPEKNNEIQIEIEEKVEKIEQEKEKEKTPQQITETFVVNFNEEDYGDDNFDRESENESFQKKKNNKKHPDRSEPVPEKIEKSRNNAETPQKEREVENKQQIKREVSKENKKKDPPSKAKKDSLLHDTSDENMNSGQIQDVPKEKPKKKKKKKNDFSDISDISQKSVAMKEKDNSLMENNDSFLHGQSPTKKGLNRNFVSEFSSPSQLNSPKKYEYNVDFEKSDSFSPEQKPGYLLNKSFNKSLLNKSKDLSPLGDFSANSLKESSGNKNSSKLQPLKEITKNNDSSQDFHKKQAKLMPIKQSTSVERPITQEGNNRKKPLLTELPSKKFESNVKFESEKFCSLNIPIKKSVKKVKFFIFLRKNFKFY